MNENINELAVKAGIRFGRSATLDGNDIARFVTTSDMKKFAELLIEQCIACVRYTDKDHIFTAHDAGVVGAAHDRAMKAIRKHFGVEV